MDRRWTRHEDRLLLKLIARSVPARLIRSEFAGLGRSLPEILGRLEVLMFEAQDGAVDRQALYLLAGRAARCKCAVTPGAYELDGRMVRLADIVREANVVLANFGKPAIAFPGVG